MKLFSLTLLAILVLATTILIQALSCSQRWECDRVSIGGFSADCVEGQCVCLTDQGFTGGATTESRCNCPLPYSVYWDYRNGLPYCVILADAVKCVQKSS